MVKENITKNLVQNCEANSTCTYAVPNPHWVILRWLCQQWNVYKLGCYDDDDDHENRWVRKLTR